MKNHEKKLSIGLLIALVGFPQISETIYTPALPNVVHGLMTNAYMAELTLTIYFLGFALGVISWGTISDYTGRKCAMLMGLFVYGIATFQCVYVENIESLLMWRLLQAFGASVGSVITQTILRDAYEGEERTKLFSVMSGALAFSPAIGPLLGGFISEYFGWRGNFSLLAILSVILFFWTLFALKETRKKEITHLSKNKLLHLFSSMISSRQLWGHVLLIGGTNGIIFGFYQEAPFVFIEQLGIQPKIYGCFGLLIAAATILAARISYRKSRHLSAQSMIKYGSISILTGAVLFTSTVLTGIFELNSGLAIAIFTLFMIFFGVGLIIPNSLSSALKPYQNIAGTAGSIFGGCYYLLIAGCTWLMSALHNGSGLSLPIYIVFLGVLIAIGHQMILEKQPAEEKA